MYLIALPHFSDVKYWIGFEHFTENLIKAVLFFYFTICFDFLAQKQRMTHNKILKYLYNSELDCLSENEFVDYEDEVANKTWTLPSTNRHVEQTVQVMKRKFLLTRTFLFLSILLLQD